MLKRSRTLEELIKIFPVKDSIKRSKIRLYKTVRTSSKFERKVVKKIYGGVRTEHLLWRQIPSEEV